mgnify:CR=1 FL=1
MTSPAPTLNMAEACALLGISTDTGYSLVRRNEFPAPVLRLGRTIRIPRAPLLALLGLTDDPPEGTQPAGRRDGTGPGRIKVHSPEISGDQKAAIRALTDAGRRMVIDPGAVPCALVEWEDKRVDL